jgi:predicted TIM-barrel fold metal-dependent hydrolase
MDSLSDPVRRLREIDEDGVAAEVLFPDDQNADTPPWLAGIAPQALDRTYPPELRLAGARAYNRWLAGFCALAPQRLLGMITLGSLADVDAAVAEVRRAHVAGLRSGIMLPLDATLPLYHHPRYEPLWAACAELDVVVAIHASDGVPDWVGDDLRAAAVYLAEINFHAQRPLWCLIYGGVLDRYPSLRLAFTEQGSGWVAGLLARLDGSAQSTMMRWTEEEPLPLLPSEYFHRQCFVGNSLMTRAEVDARHTVGVDVLMWGSDFPHLEGCWPETRGAISELFAGMPEAEARAILGDNLACAYRVDLDALAPVVDRIGPSPAELALT